MHLSMVSHAHKNRRISPKFSGTPPKKGTPWFNPPIFTMKIASNSHVIQIPVEVPTLLRCMRTSPS
jgi:hypothetical protein